MASGGSVQEQRAQIAQVATRLFGAEVTAESVIGETLTRATAERDFSDSTAVAELRNAILGTQSIPREYDRFVQSPMASWLESTFGLQREKQGGRLIRARPKPIVGEHGAAKELSTVTGIDPPRCDQLIREWLLAGYQCQEQPETKSKPFAFRLHQFISRGDSVFASLENNDIRYLSLSGQQFVPGNREKILLPLAFCRECGAEYYSVWKSTDRKTGRVTFRARDLPDRWDNEDDGEAGLLYRDPAKPWPEDLDELIDRLPDDWLETSGGLTRIRPGVRDDLPQKVLVEPNGAIGPNGLEFWFTHVPFRFCQNCGVSYRARRGESDFGRLSTLASGGRSTATTILSLTAVRFLRADDSLKEHARKLLSFTDNRQDASLQAGHFNDFVEVSLMRAALHKAAVAAGGDGVSHDELAQKVFKALDLPLELFAREPGVQFAQKIETEKAMRNVIGYRLYRDLKRGWRITSPNLEQCGLLRIDYPSLDELCRTESFWQSCHPALVSASPQTREKIARVLLDYLRRELAIDVDYLTMEFHERLQQQSSQHLRWPWAIDEQEKPELSSAVFPRSRKPGDRMYFSYLSARSGFGLYLGRRGTLPELDPTGGRLTLDDKGAICRDLFKVLSKAQFVVEAVEPTAGDGIPGYRLAASAIRWVASDGRVAFHDPIRVPNAPEAGGQTNEFFVNFYRRIVGECRGLEAREHTAQVPYEERERREKDFGDAKLPVLYCSPTMELGVDIRQLNVVNLRNVPPTPANYAQRSGRAGRSGQPALVLSYCSTGNSHDQYFFRRPDRMVAGAVTPPRLDLANEDLVRAHVNAVWLAETGQYLGNSLTDILDVNGPTPTLELLPSVKTGLSNKNALVSAKKKAQAVLDTLADQLARARWYRDGWLDQVLNQTMQGFEAACQRWRILFRAAKAQYEYQSVIIGDVSRRPQWEDAKRLRREAESQMALLTETANVIQSDFYSYRYFASEGFLPGYNFPRLPLSAYIPARRRTQGRDEFLSRPRFLAISEFGPRSIIYHEGSRYIVNKVILPVAEGDEPITVAAKQCLTCGYVHELRSSDAGPDRCESCHSSNLERLDSLLRLQNVATKRKDRINCDEEERTRLGYEIRTGLRFKQAGGLLDYRIAEVDGQNGSSMKLTYGDAATIWRINLGWSRRKEKNRYGFVLDQEKGFWQSSEQLPDEEDPSDPLSATTARVVPFVEDRRNCLVLTPTERLDDKVITSLMPALKKAIQVIYQLEDNELAGEPLPSSDDRRHILLYESAEGGAGVVRRLLDEPNAIAEIAREALRICHFDPDTGEDKRRADGATEDCEAACYDCLMSYSNQREHPDLDRQLIRQLLLDLCQSKVTASPTTVSFVEHLETLKRICDSDLERAWLDYLAARGLKLPSAAQRIFEKCGTKPDFFYENHLTAIYVDGSPHDFADRQQRDREATARMEEFGIIVVRFPHNDDWDAIISRFPNIFGTPQAIQPGAVAATSDK
jgi:hypothetical protein